MVAPGDHPRSRGVYSNLSPSRRSVTGSSPLARGLPRGDRWVGRGRGIIPARAGFTPLFWPSSPERKDHPRSRGVYWNKPGVPSGWSGSSPLARGLPQSGAWTSCHRGSSPLARGLRSDARYDYQNMGIIPARAGFTPGSPRSPIMPRDHPRSRGVYATRIWVVSAMSGSSPLARGLLIEITPHVVPLRIIPARAGFTTAPGIQAMLEADHPRSRGVYSLPAEVRRVAEGSSPLARGLRAGLGCESPSSRIIPAHAGFTTKTGRRSSPSTDHPRSRGVYFHTPLIAFQTAGSSPLARGLRCSCGHGVGVAGIIPARAGFTARRAY